MFENRYLSALYQVVKTWFPKYDFLGHYRYRVVEISNVDNRVKLQAINPQKGLPDLLYIDIYPGLAGAYSNLAPSCTVLVCFIEGDPKYPFVSHVSNFRDPGFIPVSTQIDATTSITLGNNTASFVALANLVADELDKIKTTLNSAVAPNGPVTYTPPYVPGNVSANKVKAQ